MQNTALLIGLLFFALIGLGTTGCTQGHEAGSAATINAAVSMPSSGNFRLSLTDAPHPSLSHVIVNVDHVELLVAKGSDERRLIVGQGLGPIDLLKLRDGVHLPIKDLNFKEGVIVKQFRLILKSDGNWIQRLSDNSLCNLRTPSQQQSGLKLILTNGGVEIEDNSVYSLIVDFDVDHSIVDNKNVCLLKPVLKVKSLTKVPASNDTGDDTTTTTNNPPPGDTTTTPPGDTTTTPPGDTTTTPPGDTTTTPPGDTTTGTTTTGGDTTTTTGTTDTGTTTSGDTTTGTSTTTTDPGDGAPIVVEGDPAFFNP